MGILVIMVIIITVAILWTSNGNSKNNKCKHTNNKNSTKITVGRGSTRRAYRGDKGHPLSAAPALDKTWEASGEPGQSSNNGTGPEAGTLQLLPSRLPFPRNSWATSKDISPCLVSRSRRHMLWGQGPRSLLGAAKARRVPHMASNYRLLKPSYV